MKKENDFIKVGRVYWIKPIPIPGMKSKSRPAIAIEKHGKGKTIFLQLGSTKYNHKDSIKATELFRESINSLSLTEKIQESHIHIDASKPEWNTSKIKPHHLIGGKYIDLDPKTRDTLRQIYHKRRKELEKTRFRKAKICIIEGNFREVAKQLEMIKNQNPIKHEKLNIEKWIEKYKNKLK